MPTLKLLPTSHQGGIECTGGSMGCNFPMEAAGRHWAQQGRVCLLLSTCSFPRWVSPACPALGPLYWEGWWWGEASTSPGKWPDHNFTNRSLNPGLELLIPTHTDRCSAAPGSLCVNIFQAEGSAWLQYECQSFQRNLIFKYFLTIQS